MNRDVLLDRATRVLVFGEPFLGRRDVLTRGLEPRLEGLLALGFLGELAPGVMRRGVQGLQRDEAFEVFIHGGSQQKRPR